MLVVEAAVSGLFTGGAYALIAVTITLMYRSTGVLSFAHAAFAAVGAYLYIDLVDAGAAKPLAAALAVAAATLYGLAVERVVIRSVRSADAATRLIATLGVLTFTSGVLLWHYGFSPLTAEPLLPKGSIKIADVAVSYQKVAVLAVAATASVVLAWFLDRTRFGTAVRATAEDPEAARLHGVSLVTVARFNWGIGAVLAGAIGVLIAPLQSVNVGTFTLLLAKALTATLVGGLSSLTLTFAGGLLVGVLESITVVRSTIAGAPQATVMVLVVVVLVVRRRWPEVPPAPPSMARRRRLEAPAAVRSITDRGRALVRPVRMPVALAMMVLAIVVPARSPYWSFVGGRALFFVIETLSLVLLVGWGGQVSLMQGAYVGIGAFGTGWLIVQHDVPVAAALLLAALAGTALGALVGVPALRLSGLQFATASLAFATAASSWLFVWGELPRSMPRGDLLGLDLSSDIAVYFVMLAVTVVIYGAAWNLRRSAQGRLLLAARDASATVAHFGASPARARLGVFVLASFVATLGGGLYAVLVTGLSAGDFTPFLSLTLLVYFVVGGSQSLLGPVLAGIAFGVLPQVLQSEVGASADARPTIVAGAAVVVLLALRPGGLASLVGGGQPTDPHQAPTPDSAYQTTRRRLAAADPARALETARRLRGRSESAPALLTHRR